MQKNSTSQNDIYNNLINKDKYNNDKDYSLYETSYDEKPKDEIYNSEYYSKITLNEKNEDNEDNEEDKNTEEPAPPLFFSIEPEIKSNKICDCIEIDKLLLIRSSFFYKNKINKNDFYKVVLGKNMETNNSYDYYILEINWNEEAAATRFSEWNEAANKKETDMIYITASRE